MTDRLDPDTLDDEELLAALTCGDVSAEHPIVAQRLQGSPALRADWEALAELARGLGAAGTVRRDALVAPPGDPEDEAALIAAFRAHVEAGRSRANRIRVGAWLAAAACLIVGLAAVYRLVRVDPTQRDGAPRYLAGGAIEIVPGTPFGTLRWRLSDASAVATRVELRVYAVGVEGARGELLCSNRDVDGGEYLVEPHFLAGRAALEFEIELERVGVAVPRIGVVRQTR